MSLPPTLQKSIFLRPVTEADEPLLREIYASTRAGEMVLLSHWSENEKAAFIDHQFNAQHTFYQHQYPNGRFQMISLQGEDIGRLYTDYRQAEIRIIDITLLPDYRGQGYGTHLLQNLLEEAGASQSSVTIHVERFNMALALYTKLGFKIIDDSHPIYLLLKWSAES